MSRFIKDERGQAVVEFALVAPVLLLILCGIIDFGWIFSAKIATDTCAREGARFAASWSDYESAEVETANKVRSVASSIIKDNITTVVSYSDADNPAAGDVRVEVVSEVRSLTIVAHTLFGGPVFTLESAVTMKVG
ncbi:MAG TPA: pilus assembly protein [Clostridiales bacterium]|jgi:Flp pilus assembly protein TadG|nr:pilus assembly protein [Clostridiales bacterium]